MVCVPCIVIPVLLYIWHRWLQPIALKIWNPWAKVENVKEDGGGNSSSSTAAAATCPFTGKTSNATASSSDSATCPGATATEPLANGHTVESKKND